MFTVKSDGEWTNTLRFLKKKSQDSVYSNLDRYGEMGVRALSSATPIESGATAHSWAYRIVQGHSTTTIEWYNTNEPGGVPVAILLQYGHATRGGSWVQGRDYINPAMRPVFDEIANSAWKDVKNAR